MALLTRLTATPIWRFARNAKHIPLYLSLFLPGSLYLYLFISIFLIIQLLSTCEWEICQGCADSSYILEENMRTEWFSHSVIPATGIWMKSNWLRASSGFPVSTFNSTTKRNFFHHFPLYLSLSLSLSLHPLISYSSTCSCFWIIFCLLALDMFLPHPPGHPPTLGASSFHLRALLQLERWFTALQRVQMLERQCRTQVVIALAFSNSTIYFLLECGLNEEAQLFSPLWRTAVKLTLEKVQPLWLFIMLGSQDARV